MSQQMEPYRLTPAEITRAASYRYSLGQMPPWLPERIDERDFEAIIKAALHKMHTRHGSRWPKSPTRTEAAATLAHPRKDSAV